MSDAAVPALLAPPPVRDNPFTRSVPGVIGMAFLILMLVVCVLTLPWTLGSRTIEVAREDGSTQRIDVARYVDGDAGAGRLPPSWVTPSPDQARQLNALVDGAQLREIATRHAVEPEGLVESTSGPASRELRRNWPTFLMGTDVLGRSLLIRSLAGGGISLSIGLAAAALSVFIGTLYGALAGYLGGRVDAVMMRIVDVLYGLPYILLVILLAVASSAVVDEYVSRQGAREAWIQRELSREALSQGLPADGPALAQLRERDKALAARLDRDALLAIPPRSLSAGARSTLDVIILLVAIGGVSWLTMARVIRGQVLSLKHQPFIEAARALGIPPLRIFIRHLLPNLGGTIIVYATLTVPQAILQESFLSFLGIGVRTPLPSWGNLAADGLPELNPYQSNWWLLLFPCLFLASTLLALNFVGEGLREAMDPKRARR